MDGPQVLLHGYQGLSHNYPDLAASAMAQDPCVPQFCALDQSVPQFCALVQSVLEQSVLLLLLYSKSVSVSSNS